MIGNPQNLAIIPNNLQSYVDNMNFWGRMSNVLFTFYSNTMFHYFTTSVQNEIIKNSFGKNTPNLVELLKTFSLVLTNSHPSVHGVGATTPALIEVGGLHVLHDDGPELSIVIFFFSFIL